MKANYFVILILGLLLVTISTDQVFAQGGLDFNFIGAGARARGMGGAFIGGADDATAASWNPAGLVFLEKTEASVTYVYSSVFESIDNESVEDLGLSHGYLNFVSAAIPLSIGARNVVGCLAYQRVIDLFNKSFQTLYDANQIPYDYDTHQKGGVDAISPSLGIQVSPQFSLGLAYNIYTGGLNEKWTYLDTDEEVDAPKETYTGSNISMGGLFDFGKFRIGAVYKTPFTLKSERDEELNAGGLINFWGYEFEMKMPAMLGLGISFEPTPNLRLAADFEMRSFSKFETRTTWTSPDRQDENSDEFIKAELEDVNQFRVGAEYLLMAGNSFIPLRIGFKTEPKPYKDYNDDQVVGAALTLGTGLVGKSYTLGLTLEYSALTLKNDYYDGFSYTESEITTSQLNFLVSGIFYFGN